jgi:hypothetical protein
VSLFASAPSDPADPVGLAQFTLPGSSSAAEQDPHGFLYWPPTGLLVLPIVVGYDVPGCGQRAPAGGSNPGVPAVVLGSPGRTSVIAPSYLPLTGVLVLHVGVGAVDQVGLVSQPSGESSGALCGLPGISRSLVVDNTLWTVSLGGLMASDLNTLDQVAWLPVA